MSQSKQPSPHTFVYNIIGTEVTPPASSAAGCCMFRLSAACWGSCGTPVPTQTIEAGGTQRDSSDTDTHGYIPMYKICVRQSVCQSVTQHDIGVAKLLCENILQFQTLM